MTTNLLDLSPMHRRVIQESMDTRQPASMGHETCHLPTMHLRFLQKYLSPRPWLCPNRRARHTVRSTLLLAVSMQITTGSLLKVADPPQNERIHTITSPRTRPVAPCIYKEPGTKYSPPTDRQLPMASILPWSLKAAPVIFPTDHPSVRRLYTNT